ncbi:MAG TPA: PIN domain-containing protein [Candidatus Binatia bacterium]|nr:PIN domain-containing protein [Candidatus Binatia bacterium]
METQILNVADALIGVQRLFLDTAPVIYHVEGVAIYQPLTDIVFQGICNGAFEAVTSSVTLAECLVQPYRRGDMTLVQQFRDVITAGVHTRYVGVGAVAERAAELRARYNLSLTDAFQIAAALATSCEAFLTNDVLLKRVTELRILVLDELLPNSPTSQ